MFDEDFIFPVPASSTPSERTFSVAGRIIEERRTCLLPSTVDDIVFLHGLVKPQQDRTV